MTTERSDESARPDDAASAAGTAGEPEDATGAAEDAGAAGATEDAEGRTADAGGPGSGRTGREIPFADNIHGLVDDLLEGVRNFTPVASVRYPRYDFVETPGAYLLAFDLPGIERGGVSVTTEGEDVVVSGERTSPDWGEESTVRRRERAFGSFRRAIRMPADVRIDEIRAKLEDGILTVTLPRHTESTARKVDIEG